MPSRLAAGLACLVLLAGAEDARSQVRIAALSECGGRTSLVHASDAGAAQMASRSTADFFHQGCFASVNSSQNESKWFST